MFLVVAGIGDPGRAFGSGINDAVVAGVGDPGRGLDLSARNRHQRCRLQHAPVALRGRPLQENVRFPRGLFS